MRKIIFLLLFFGVFMGIEQAFAQPKGFSNDPLKFIPDIESYFRDAKVDDDTRKALSEFKQVYNGGVFSEEQKQIIIATANKMADRKMKAGAEYKDYLITLTLLSKAKPENFTAVHSIMDKLMLRKNRDAANFLGFTTDFFNGNNLLLSKSTQWIIPEDSYVLEFDSVPKVTVAATIDLLCTARGDRSVIYGTSGVYYPLKKLWIGNKGTVNWARGGLDSTAVYAELKRYTIDCGKSDYSADSVLFYHKELFKAPLLGRLEDRLTTNNKPETATYPKFDSYEKNYAIKDFFKNVDYSGGFSMAGSKLFGTGNESRKASIVVYANDTVALRTFADKYILQANEIVSYPAEVSIYMGSDSIYHPGVEFKFNSAKRSIILLRQQLGIGNSAFADSYHSMTFEPERVEWKIDQPFIELGMIQGRFQQEANFESKNFYKEEKFRKVQGIMDYNPLSVLKRLSLQQKSTIIGISSYANAVNLSENQVIGLLREMVEQGFVQLNEEKRLILIKEKTFNYISNNAGNLDYDVLRFSSLADSNINAILHLENKDLEVRGIDRIFLSDSQNVMIRPKYGVVKVQKNRDMQFSGKVTAGTLDFYGKDFFFEYDRFKIALPKIDSMKIKILGKPDANGRRELIELRSALHDINGDLYIDEANNKSGLKDYPEYPYFESNRESYVYYDARHIHGGVYRRSDFYFKVEPFRIDSLDNLSATTGIAFPGQMHSGGIFPDFNEVLRVQPDTSLGFVTQTPADGFMAYGGKGKYFQTIRLSDKGFYGNGVIEYIASESKSDNFLFMLDSVNAPLISFELERQAMNPDTRSYQSHLHWVPYNDTMYVSNLRAPIDMYEAKNRFYGTIAYTPVNLSGNGTAKIPGADLNSKRFVFNPDDFVADTSSVNIFAMELNKVALYAANLNSKIDFIAERGDFKSNQIGRMIDFPFNNYATTLPDFTWYFNNKYVEFLSPAGSDTSDFSFISKNVLQDSLNFHSTNAIYDLRDARIDIYGVPKILIGDAEVLPDSNYVEIHGDAQMKRLKNAVINANITTRYHRLYNATVDILGRKKYYGDADYKYKNTVDSSYQVIHFSKFEIDSTLKTIARGVITDSMSFLLNKKISYKGDVILKAPEQFLTYDGFVKMNHNSQLIVSEFFRYKGVVNPDTVITFVNDPRNVDKARLFTGVHVGNLNYEGYGTFLSRKIEPNDLDVIKVEGLLTYDEKTNLYKIGDTSKIFGNALTGKYLTFSDTAETFYAEGKLDLGAKFGNKVTMEVAGNVTDRMGQNDMQIDAVMSLDFEFLDEATKLMLKNLELSGFDVEGTRDDRPVFAKGIAELFPEKDVKKVLEDIRQSGTYKLPSSMQHGFMITDLQLYWDQERRSWRSSNDKIGIAAVGNKQLNKRYKGYFEIVRKRSGNIINIYFQTGPADWYFYTFRQGQMEAISSDDAFNKILMEKTKARSPWSISAMKRKLDFVRSFNNN